MACSNCGHDANDQRLYLHYFLLEKWLFKNLLFQVSLADNLCNILSNPLVLFIRLYLSFCCVSHLENCHDLCSFDLHCFQGFDSCVNWELYVLYSLLYLGSMRKEWHVCVLYLTHVYYFAITRVEKYSPWGERHLGVLCRERERDSYFSSVCSMRGMMRACCGYIKWPGAAAVLATFL